MPTCLIIGSIRSLDGAAALEVQVRATVQSTEQGQSGQIASGGGVTSEAIVAFTDTQGAFAIPVLQGAVVELEIPAINLRKVVTVPLAAGPVDFTTLI